MSTYRDNGQKKQPIYNTSTWQRLRRMAKQRDCYLCQECLRNKRITKATEVHHLQSVDDHPELALSLDNLVSLCRDCHEATKRRSKPERSIPASVRVIRIK